MLPLTTVTLSEVRDALGESTNSLAGLCASKRINIYSLRRPIVHSTLSDLTDAERRAADFGFIINGYSTPAELLAALKAGSAWSAPLPNGNYAGGNSAAWQPARLGDFRGYDHRALPFVPHPGAVTLDPVQKSFTFFADSYPTAAEALSWKLAATIKNCYPCVCIFKPDGALLGYKTSSSGLITIVGQKSTVEAAIAGSDDDLTLQAETDYTYMLCLCSGRKATFTATASAPRFYPIPAPEPLFGTLSRSILAKNIRFTLRGVRGGLTDVVGQYITFDAPARYAFQQSGSEAEALAVGATGNLTLLIDITNAGSRDVTNTYLRLHAAPTLVDTRATATPQLVPLANDPGGLKVQTIENSKITISTEFTVPAGSSLALVMHCPGFLATNQGGTVMNIPTGTEATTILTAEFGDSAGAQNILLQPAILAVKR